MQLWILIIHTAVLSLTCAASSVSPKTPLQFETLLNPNSELHQYLRQAYRSIFHSLGYEFTSISLPPKRGLVELKEGRVDGSLGRVGNVSRFIDHPNLIRVDVPVAEISISRWCRNDLKPGQRPIKLGVRLGSLALAKIKPHVDSRIVIEEMGTEQSIVHMLQSSRIDCLISSELLLESDGVNMQLLKGFQRFDLVVFELYPWILKRHGHLKDKLESGLRSYTFPEGFRRKFFDRRAACDGKLNLLCPDGLLIKSKADLS